MGLFFLSQKSAKNAVFGHFQCNSFGRFSKKSYLDPRMWYSDKYKCVSLMYRKNQFHIYPQKEVRGPKGERLPEKETRTLLY